MRKKTTKCRCEKRIAKKCIGICRTYSNIQAAYAVKLEENNNIKSFSVNVALSGELDGYSTDFLCETVAGDTIIRECITRKMLERITNCKLLDLSRKYWLDKGVADWGLVIDGD